MNFSTKVQAITPFQFSPTDAVLYVTKPYDKVTEDGVVKVFDVEVHLRQSIEGGEINQRRKHTFPVAVLDAIVGFDKEKFEPEINWSQVAPLFQQFNLNII